MKKARLAVVTLVVVVAHVSKGLVLGRLNMLGGIRAADQKRYDEASSVLVAGLRFARHLSGEGTLLGLISGRALALGSYRELQRLAEDKALREARNVSGVVTATELDWPGGIERELASIGVYARTSKLFMRSSPKPVDLGDFNKLTPRIVSAFRQAPDRTRASLKELEPAIQQLDPVLREALPSLTKVNDLRAELQQSRERLLKLLN